MKTSTTLKTRVYAGSAEFLPGDTFTVEHAGSQEAFDHVCRAQDALSAPQPILPSDIDSSRPGNLQVDPGVEAARVRAEQEAKALEEIEKSKLVAASVPESVPETRTNFDPSVLTSMSLEDLNLLVIADGVTPPFETKQEAITFLSHSFSAKE